MKKLLLTLSISHLTLFQTAFAGGGIKIGNGPFENILCFQNGTSINITPTKEDISNCEKQHDSIYVFEKCICERNELEYEILY